MDFSNPVETLEKFQALIVDAGIVSERYSGLLTRYQEAPIKDQAYATSRIDEAYALIKECKAAQDKMHGDKSLRIRVGGKSELIKSASSRKSNSKHRRQSIDLLGVRCPFNYVKTKLKMETLSSGEILEVLLDAGEPANNVPKSIQNDGHKVLLLEKVDNHFKLVIEKV